MTSNKGADLSEIAIHAGTIPFVDKFKYLGSLFTWNCKGNADVDSRVRLAGSAFGMLRKCVFASKSIWPQAKRAVDVNLVLAILLYGSETWSLTEEVYHRLRLFHSRCVRAMYRVTR